MVIEVAGADRRKRLARDLAIAVVQRCAGQQQGTVGDHAAALVIEQLAGAEGDIATPAEHAFGIVQASAAHIQAGGVEMAFEVGQQLVDTQGQCLVADQFTVAVIQVFCDQGKSVLAGDFAVAVVDIGEVVQCQQRCVDHTRVDQCAVVQVKVELCGADQFGAVQLRQAGDAGIHCADAGDMPAVGELGGAEVELVGADHTAVDAVGELSGVNGCQALAFEQAVGVIQAGTGQCEVLGAFDGAALVD